MFAVIDGAQPPSIRGADFSNTSSVYSSTLSGSYFSTNGRSAHSIVFWLKGNFGSNTEQIWGILGGSTGANEFIGYHIRIESGKLVVVQGDRGSASTAHTAYATDNGRRWTSTNRLVDAAGWNATGWNCIFIQINGNAVNYSPYQTGYTQTSDIHMYVNHSSIGCTNTQVLNYLDDGYITTISVNNAPTGTSSHDSDAFFPSSGTFPVDSFNSANHLTNRTFEITVGSTSYTGVTTTATTGGTQLNHNTTVPTINGAIPESETLTIKNSGMKDCRTFVAGAITHNSATQEHFTGSLGPVYVAKDTYADWSDATLRNQWTDSNGKGHHKFSAPYHNGYSTINTSVDYDNGASNQVGGQFNPVHSPTMITSGTNVTADTLNIRQI